MYKYFIFLFSLIVFFFSCNPLGKKQLDNKTMTDIIEKIMIAHVYYSKQSDNLPNKQNITIPLDSLNNEELKKTIAGILKEYNVSISDFQSRLDKILEEPELFRHMLDTIYNRIDYYRK